MSEWQPIETAPKDGSRIIGWVGEIVTLDYVPPCRIGSKGHIHIPEQWVQESDSGRCTPFMPTHWMPLPSPPTGADTP